MGEFSASRLEEACLNANGWLAEAGTVDCGGGYLLGDLAQKGHDTLQLIAAGSKRRGSVKHVAGAYMKAIRALLDLDSALQDYQALQASTGSPGSRRRSSARSKKVQFAPLEAESLPLQGLGSVSQDKTPASSPSTPTGEVSATTLTLLLSALRRSAMSRTARIRFAASAGLQAISTVLRHSPDIIIGLCLCSLATILVYIVCCPEVIVTYLAASLDIIPSYVQYATSRIWIQLKEEWSARMFGQRPTTNIPAYTPNVVQGPRVPSADPVNIVVTTPAVQDGFTLSGTATMAFTAMIGYVMSSFQVDTHGWGA